MYKRILSLFLVTAMLLSAAACGKGSEEDGDTSASGNNGGTPPQEETVSREDTPDTLPADLNFNDQTITFYYFGIDDVKYYDAIGDGTGGDVALSAVYNRNLLTEERLGVKLNWQEGSSDWDGFPNEVREALMSGINDWDVVLEENSRLFQQSVEGYYFDFLTLADSYVDLDQPWWYAEMMEEGSIDNTKRFYITGDIDMSTKFGASTLFFNKPIFRDKFGDTQALYDLVTSGKWTYEQFMQYCREVYNDTDGDGMANDGDTFGFTWETWGSPNYMSMSNGLTYVKRDDKGLPVLDLFNEQSVKWGETFYNLLNTDNMSLFTDAGQDGKRANFIRGTDLFMFGQLSDALRLRDVEFEYGVLPYPKLSEDLDYISGAATANGTGVGIPVSTPMEKIPAATAAIEALCAQSYRTVVPAFYESALKFKYLETEVDAQMIDLITSKITCPFIMIADKMLQTGSIFVYAIVLGENTNGAFASYYAANESAIQANWDAMIEAYQNATND